MSSIFIFLILPFQISAQTTDQPIHIEFIKNTDSLKTGNLYFNVVKLVNNTSKPITGNLFFSSPENWTTLSIGNSETTVPQNDTLLVPIRVSPASDALGGITYVINAAFKNKKNQINTNTYLTLPTKAKWDFSTNKTSIYFTESNPNATFKILLSNKGNTNEIIKVKLKIGKLLVYSDNKSAEVVEYVNLPAFKDTIIYQTVTFQKDLTFEERLRYQNNWKESSINVTASTDKIEKSAAIVIRKLSSIYVHQRLQNSYPLNIDYQVYNLMSNQLPRSNLKVFGDILFKKNREFDYMLGVQNLYYNRIANQNFDIDRQLIYNFRYSDNRNKIEIGYNINGGSLHTLNGRGIVGSYKFNNNTRLTYTATQNPFSKVLGQQIGVNTSIKGISLLTDIIHESNDRRYSATSVNVGTGFTLFRHHSFSFQVLGSQSNYLLPTDRDTTVLGFSFKANYAMRTKKFDFRISAMNSMYNYIRNSGFENIYLDSKYILNDKVRFNMYGNRQRYSTTRYPYNFYNEENYNTTDYLRITTSISESNVIYQLGPNYTASTRQFINPISSYKSEYQTYQPGLWAAATFKIAGYRSITPNLTVSNLRFYYNTEDPTLSDYSFDKNIYYSVGLNYYDPHWKLNAYYSSGTTSDLYRTVQTNEQPRVSKSIQARPSYESYFFKRTVRLSANLNYAYYMPSGRENVSYNVQYDQFLKGGWSFSLSGFVYSNSRITDDVGRVNTKDINFVLGIRKSFNFQQPRTKYYDFKSVFYNDLDGNRQKTDNEPPVADVLVKIEKNRLISKEQTSTPEVELISDANGQIEFINMPKDDYNLSFTPLVNLQSLYFLDGYQQKYYSDKKRTLYIPLTESYKIKGKVTVVRDTNSSEGKLDLSGIKIIAKNVEGENYSILTDNFGAFLINVPSAGKYNVSVVNVFGENYYIDNSEMDIQFLQNKTIQLDFIFYEKTRGIQFENGTEIHNFNNLTANEGDEATTPPVKKNYSIQIARVSKYVDPKVFKDKYKLKYDVSYTEKDGTYSYYIGSFSSVEAARKEINRLGIKESFAMEINPSILKKEAPVVVTPPAKVVQKDTVKTEQKPLVTDSVQKNAPTQPNITENKTSIKKVETKAVENIAPADLPSLTADETETSGTYYSIQLDALKTYVDPKIYKEKYVLKQDVRCVEENGIFKYLTGRYKNTNDARADIARYGMSGYIIFVKEIKQTK